MGTLFISHASADKPLVNELVTLVTSGLGISFRDIVYTSGAGMDVPAGNDFVTYIQDKVAEANIVLFILSPNFFASRFCLCELGAAWMLEKPKFPLLVPPLDRNDVVDVLRNVQIENIESRNGLNKLKEKMEVAFALPATGVSHWEDSRNVFIARLDTILKDLPTPRLVPAAEVQEHIAMIESLKREIDRLHNALLEKDGMIDDLKACKNAGEVREVVKAHSSEWDQFKELIQKTRESLSSFTRIVKLAMFRAPDSYEVDYFDQRSLWDDALDAHDRRLVFFENGWVGLREEHPRISDCRNEIRSLSQFLKTASEDFHFDHIQKYNVEADIANLEFWETHLGL